jgi:hypothetical protein
MAWIYLAVSEDSHSLYRHGSGQSPIVREIDTLWLFSCQECKREGFIPPRSGMRYLLSKPLCCQLSTLFMVDSPARISALVVLERAWRESEADYFSRSCAWPMKSNLVSYSLRTSAEYAKNCISLEGNWPISAMIVGGVLYPLTMWERRTKEKDGFCWHTPRASETYERYETYLLRMQKKKDPKSRGKKKPGSLSMQIGGNPSPIWLEWLMGYPTGWTELEESVTQWYRSKRVKRSKDCVASSNPA